MGNIFQGFIGFLKNPVGQTGSGSAFTLFLLIGLVFVLIAVWGQIFVHIREAI